MADYDRQRAERDFNMNPPTNAPGQGDDGWGDLFSNSSSTGIGDGGFTGADTDINSILNGQSGNQEMGMPGMGMPGMGMPGGMPGVPQQNQSIGTKIGDKLDDFAVKGAEGAWSYLKMLVNSLRNNTEGEWNTLGTRICKLSVGIIIVSVIFFILSIFIPTIKGVFELSIGGLVSCGIGVMLVSHFNKDKPQVVDESVVSDSFDDEGSGGEDFVWDDPEDDDLEESDYNSDDNDWGSVLGSTGFDDVDSSFFASNESFDAKEAVNDLPDIPAGQYTRQYLFETFSKILPSVEPSFMNMEDVIDGSDEFMMFEDFMRRSAEQTGLNEDKLDELQLLEVRKNLFIIQLIATRPTGLKEKDIANGIADCYKRDDYGMTIPGREGVFSRVNSQVGKLIIDIFLCNNVMVSLGDVYRQKSDFLLDSKNIMPLVWGVNEMGQVFCYDGMKDGNGGIIISGEARSGKSWKGQSLIAQMCMFRSPKELELYFYDVKGEASDYAYLSRVLPHCKGFCGESLKFNDSIGTLLERECKRRTNLLAGKYTNVKDYNKDHPYDQIPTIYIIIDEMATAMSEMKDKDIEIRKKFDSLLIQIATKYPYLEIKLMLFPHRIVNDIINKTVSSMISTRSVMGNVPADELKTALDIKKDFPYSLVKTGDMAIKTKSLNNGNAVYSHSEVLSTDEQVNRKIFDYIGAVWKKLEPECKTLSESTKSIKGTTTSNRNRVSKPPKDTSVYSEDYSYNPSINGFVGASSIEDMFDDGKEVDESFWDEALGDNKSESDDSFWADWNK